MTAEAAIPIYRPPHRIDKPGHNQKIGRPKYAPKLKQNGKPKWSWNDPTKTDPIYDGMEYLEAFEKVIETLAAPDPTDKFDFQAIYHTPVDDNSSDKNLMIAVLFSAWCDLHGFGIPQKRRKAIVEREVYWMQSGDEKYIYSFNSICDTLGIDKSAVFKAMLNGTKAKRKYAVCL